MEWHQGDYSLNDQRDRTDIGVVAFLLGNSYWAARRPLALIQKSIQHSLCFNLLHHTQQIGFGRVISDFATFSYLCDVIIHPDHQRKGLGKWMVQCILEHPDLKGTRFNLFTKDAQGLYEKFGFCKHEFECLVRPVPKSS